MKNKKETSQVYNALQCPKCHEIIVSRFIHDFVYCECKSIFIDGRLDYLKYGFKNIDSIKIKRFKVRLSI